MKNLILTILLLSFSLFLSFRLKLEAFDTSRVLEDIKFLSSENLQGRLTGTLENRIAGEYIKSSFLESGLNAYKDSFYHSFPMSYPKYSRNTPLLQVITSDGIINSYSYGTDFKEDLLNFKVNEITFTLKDIRYSEDYILVNKDDSTVLFSITKNEDFNFRSSFIIDAPYSLYIAVSEACFRDMLLELQEGKSIYCSVPYKIAEEEAYNIIATNNKSITEEKDELILSCHFDHIGADPLENLYGGALDNASGTAFLLELARFCKGLGESDIPLIFAAFNGEEFGCLGSKAFADKYYDEIKNATVFNFDMIGSNKNLPLTIMGGKEDNGATDLIAYLSNSFRNRNIPFNVIYEDSSDHEHFRKLGIDALTLTHADLDNIHTPSDTIDHISPEAISSAFTAFYPELIKKAYKSNPYIYFNISGLIGTLLLIGLSIYYFKDKP